MFGNKADWFGRRDLAPLAAIALVLAIFLAGGLFNHPQIQHDDYPFILLSPAESAEVYFPKTLEEGRWLNYAWAFLSPRFVGIGTALPLFWGLYAALALLILLQLEERSLSGLVVLTAILLANKPILDLGLWPATSIPALLSVTGCAYLIRRASTIQGCRALLALGALLAFQSFPPFAFVLLLLVLHRFEAEGPAGHLLTLAWFCAGAGASVLASCSLNYLAHGIFGVVPADWRMPHLAHDFGALRANLVIAARDVWHLARSSKDLVVLALAGGLYLAWRHPRRLLALSIGTGLALGFQIALVAGTGIRSADDRIWAWVPTLAALCLSGLLAEAMPARGRVLLAFILLVVALHRVDGRVQEYERDGVFVAEAARAMAQNGTRTIIMANEHRPEIMRIGFRLSSLGAAVRYCSDPRTSCEGIDRSRPGIYRQEAPMEAIVVNVLKDPLRND